MPTTLGYGPTRCRKDKSDICHILGIRPKNGTWRINLIQCSREEAKSRGQKDITAQGGQASNLLNIALSRLAPSCFCLCPFFLRLGGRALAPSVLCSMRVYATNRETTQQTSKERSKKDRKHEKNILTKKAKRGQTNMLSTQMGKQTGYQTKCGVLGGKMLVWIECPQFHCVGVWTTHACHQAKFLKGLGVSCIKDDVNPHEIVGTRLDDTCKQDSCKNI